MQIENHQLIDEGQTYNLPLLPYDALVRVWRVPTEYRDTGLFISIKHPGKPWEVPACAHGAPDFEAELPADADAVATVAKQQLQQQYEDAVQKHLDTVARQHGYDSILSACSYAGVNNPYQAESEAFISWRAAVWVHCYQVLTDVLTGNLAQPSVEELIAGLPVAPQKT